MTNLYGVGNTNTNNPLNVNNYTSNYTPNFTPNYTSNFTPNFTPINDLPMSLGQGFSQANQASQASKQDFRVDIPDTPTSKDVSNSIVNQQKLPSNVEQGIKDTTPTNERVLDTTTGVQDIISAPSTRYQTMLDQSGITESRKNLIDLFSQVRDIVAKPAKKIDDTDIKIKEQALTEAQKALTDTQKIFAEEENRIREKWGVGPIWRGRLGLFQTQKAIQLQPLLTAVSMASGNLENAQRQAQQMFENAVNKQQLLVNQLSNIFNMSSGIISNQEAQALRAYQFDETERLRILKQEQNTAKEKRDLFLKYPFFNMTDTIEEIQQKVAPYIKKEKDLERLQALTNIARINEQASGESEKPLSLSGVNKFRDIYGWTPPIGYTMSQLEQYIKDNPNATPEELEAGARGVTITQKELSETNIEESIKKASKAGFSAEEISSYLVKEFGIDKLFDISKRMGFASMWTGKATDVKRMVNKLY